MAFHRCLYPVACQQGAGSIPFSGGTTPRTNAFCADFDRGFGARPIVHHHLLRVTLFSPLGPLS